ncbi:MAG: hypothetical protein PHC83_06930 [Bacteroidales bacterium]|nr:hypothetical protein [Bacteroidales bacterium]MDD4209741.1 hypothetical protein [Bacteroidales bacterium]
MKYYRILIGICILISFVIFLSGCKKESIKNPKAINNHLITQKSLDEITPGILFTDDDGMLVWIDPELCNSIPPGWGQPRLGDLELYGTYYTDDEGYAHVVCVPSTNPNCGYVYEPSESGNPLDPIGLGDEIIGLYVDPEAN